MVCEEIFKHSVQIHAEKALEADVVVDTTVQEKNITFPTDTKLHCKIIGKILSIAKREGIKLYRTYAKEIRSLMRTIRFSKSSNPVQRKAVRRSKRRLKTIAGKLVREVQRKLLAQGCTLYCSDVELFLQMLEQKKNSKNKIYSLHEPQVSCIAKGKAHKKYEFGAKAGLVVTKQTTIIVGVQSFEGNPYDGDTLEQLLCCAERVTGQVPKNAYCDRGFRGRDRIGQTQIHIPGPPHVDQTPQESKEAQKNFGRRSAIEPVIGHTKHDFRMNRCYLKGARGDAINLFMAAAAFNFKKWLREAAYCFFYAIFALCSCLRGKCRGEVTV